ncbi:hypothetical protein BFS25_09245 [Bifidobacterium longum subsp. infantis]|nr:hypothetical protein BFS25_09245 [Bifidobacterium longum subsp. infantis]
MNVPSVFRLTDTLRKSPVPSNADNAFEAASFAQKAALRSTEEAIRNDASSSEENTNRMIPSDNPSESSTSTPTARILSADATAATHSDGQCDSDPTMPDGQSGSPSEPLSMGPSWPIRRKASWAKRRVSVNSLLRLAVAFPTKARSPSNNRTRRVPSPEISTSQPEASSGPNRRARRIMRSAHIMETLSTETHKPSNSKAFYQFPE